jgi:nucleotide-binding universal stress UspA family protein
MGAAISSRSADVGQNTVTEYSAAGVKERSGTMYAKILVPLDASKTAEQVLSYIKSLVAPTGTVHLVSVVEPNMYAYALAGREAAIRDKLQAVIHSELESYLAEMRTTLQRQGYTVQTWVARGDAAQTIADVATKINADLIAMTTHGRSGFARWALGSVADRVIHIAHQPILLVRMNGEMAAEYTIRQLLTPLDGSPLAEEALVHAEQIAQQTGATIRLLRVVEPLSSWQKTLLTEHGYDEHVLEAERTAEANDYLTRMHERLQNAGIENHAQLYVGSAADAILAVLDKEPIDLVVMCTHGLSGYSRWVYGSVAGKVLYNADCPLLLLRSVEVTPSEM